MRLNAKNLFTLEIGVRAAAKAAGRGVVRAVSRTTGPTDIYLCLADHYEPHVGGAADAEAHVRHEDWLHRYPLLAARHRDADGRPPAHSFFYPWDEFDGWEFERLSAMCAEGWGEVELHLHHRDDTSTSLRHTLREAVGAFHDGGTLSEWPDGRPAFGFVHGNWALDNSRHEGERNFCGVNNELDILTEEGCFADFTFPAWQHTAQPRQLNSIFYATDDPDRPKSYDRGQAARVGIPLPDADRLLLVQGPLVPFRKGRRVGMDDGDLAVSRRYAPARLDRWVEAGIGVRGRPDRVFIKLHCHGAADANRAALLDTDLDALFSDAEARYNDGRRYRLHYVTAREMYNVVCATIEGADADALRDWRLPPPDTRRPIFPGIRPH